MLAAAQLTKAETAFTSTSSIVNAVPTMSATQEAIADIEKAEADTITCHTGTAKAMQAASTTEEKAATTADADTTTGVGPNADHQATAAEELDVDEDAPVTSDVDVQAPEATTAPDDWTADIEASDLSVLEKLGIKDIHYAELNKLVQVLLRVQPTRMAKAKKAMIDRHAEEAKQFGLSEFDLAALYKAKGNHEDLSLFIGGKPKKPEYLDRDRQPPAIGVTYLNPNTNRTWTKKKHGRTPEDFVALLKEGHTWAELEHPA